MGTWLPVLVAAAAVCGVACVLLSRRRAPTRAVRRPDGAQEATIRVEGAYEPAEIELEAGVPAVLRFDRREDDPCSERLTCEVLPSEYRLAAHAVTEIRFTPQAPGVYAFTCGLGLYAGRLVVRAARPQTDIRTARAGCETA